MLCLCFNLQFFPLPLSPLGDIPIVPLNFVMISLEGPFSRDIVEGCVKETLLFLEETGQAPILGLLTTSGQEEMCLKRKDPTPSLYVFLFLKTQL